MKFDNLTFISKGTHSLVFRGQEIGVENSPPYCLKLFRQTWVTPFNLELAAYERLSLDRGTRKYIPYLYGYGHRTLSEWGFDRSSTDKDIYSGLVMEWIEDAEPLSAANATIHNTSILLAGLSKIHSSGVLHNDTFLRNSLIVPGTRKAVWIDFSCAHLNEESNIPVEMEVTARSILWKVRALILKADIYSFMIMHGGKVLAKRSQHMQP
jgi:serine/threonine protein kinase